MLEMCVLVCLSVVANTNSLIAQAVAVAAVIAVCSFDRATINLQLYFFAVHPNCFAYIWLEIFLFMCLLGRCYLLLLFLHFFDTLKIVLATSTVCYCCCCSFTSQRNCIHKNVHDWINETLRGVDCNVAFTPPIIVSFQSDYFAPGALLCTRTFRFHVLLSLNAIDAILFFCAVRVVIFIHFDVLYAPIDWCVIFSFALIRNLNSSKCECASFDNRAIMHDITTI